MYLNLQTILSKKLMKTGYFLKINFKYLERFERELLIYLFLLKKMKIIKASLHLKDKNKAFWYKSEIYKGLKKVHRLIHFDQVAFLKQ